MESGNVGVIDVRWQLDRRGLGDDQADAVFGAKVKDSLLWALVKAPPAYPRAGPPWPKTRAHVQGGGKKPYPQKGTGNARQGSSRAPNPLPGPTRNP